jgi:large subunit ribosomal protein L32e
MERKKPAVRKESSPKLKARKKIKKKKPGFKRQEGFKHVKLSDSWRRPRGRHSKMRKKEKARGSHPSIGYSSPRSVRGLDKFGYREVRVSRPGDIEGINPKEEVVIISGSVGKRKRTEIVKAAEERRVRVKNF